jgi:putative ABC transport system substrate-binding protein
MRRVFEKRRQDIMNKKNGLRDRIRNIRIIISILLLVSVFFLVYHLLLKPQLGLNFVEHCSKPEVYRVGVLSGLNVFVDVTDGFKERMTELGYIEGKNIIYDIQETDFDMVVYDRILKKFVEDKVDLILAFPTEAAMQAKTISWGTGIPVVFTCAYTENTNLVNTVQEPGGNITGVRWHGPEIAIKSFKVMHELVPHIKRIVVPYQKDYPIVKSQLEVLGPAASSAGITVIEIPASNVKELETEIQKLTGPFHADVFQLIAEPLAATAIGFPIVSKFASEHKILIGGAPIFEGDYQSVFVFIPANSPQGRQAANMADKIFKGTPAGKILVATAPYLFHFNYRQAQKLGLEVSEDLLSQADIIIR